MSCRVYEISYEVSCESFVNFTADRESVKLSLVAMFNVCRGTSQGGLDEDWMAYTPPRLQIFTTLANQGIKHGLRVSPSRCSCVLPLDIECCSAARTVAKHIWQRLVDLNSSQQQRPVRGRSHNLVSLYRGDVSRAKCMISDRAARDLKVPH